MTNSYMGNNPYQVNKSVRIPCMKIGVSHILFLLEIRLILKLRSLDEAAIVLV